MSGYDHAEVREFWQYVWEQEDVYTLPADATDPTYVLGMFPYTSGELHMGHVRNYAITDAYARYRRMCGDDVLHPMGWDAFGLPAENAAFERNTDPERWTRACIERMREELESLGFGYDWSREITTCDPAYYRWNQWLFVRLYEAGLVEYTAATVNWCPDCETVLADAQVAEGRLCWRCESPVERRELDQWFFTITDYAEELHEGLDGLSGWPEGVREIQRNWIGRQEGAEISFELPDGEVEVFSARPDTVYGATFLALSPGHELVGELTDDDRALADAVDALREGRPGEAGYDGVDTGLSATHPLTGEKLPVYVAPYVLEDVGTGAVMGVPGHNERDHAFAREHGLPVVGVVEPAAGGGDDGGAGPGTPGANADGTTGTDPGTPGVDADEGTEADSGTPGTDAEGTTETDDTVLPYTGEGRLIDSGEYTDFDSEEARERLLAEVEAIEPTTIYRLRDWLISRQRYWGTPIPIVHCPDCGRVPVPESELPVELPEFVKTTGNPLDAAEEWKRATCPECGGPAVRETDTMDTFVDSSWYFLRFLSPGLAEAPFDPELAAEWLPVDLYVGGDEHATLHLLYLRFFTKALADLGLLDRREPVDRLLSQGRVLYDGEKMSTSRGNVVAPQEYGAETTRLFVLSAAHPTRDFEWTANDVRAAYDLQQELYETVVSFVDAVERDRGTWRLVDRDGSAPRDEYVAREVDRTVAVVTEEFERFRYHRAFAEIRELARLLRRYREHGTVDRGVCRRAVGDLARLVAPMAPHLAEELWNRLDGEGLVVEADWPEPETVGRPRAERRLLERTREDVREIVDVVEIEDPTRIELVVAPAWKHRIAELARGSGDVRAALPTAEVDAPAAAVDAFVAELAERGSDPAPLDGEGELAVLSRGGWLLEAEFDAEVEVRRGVEGEELAETARPGKPAIHIG